MPRAPANGGRAPAATFDEVSTLDRLDGDRELLTELAGLFAEQHPQFLNRTRTALEQEDGPGLLRAAHTMKGSVANFGATALVTALEQLETHGRSGDWTGARAGMEVVELHLERLAAELERIGKES